MKTPHKVLYDSDADLSHLKNMEAGTKTRHVVDDSNAVLLEISHLIPQPKRLSLLQDQSPSLDFIEDTHDDNYVSSEEMLQDVRHYTTALDFNSDTHVDRDGLQGKSPRGGFLPWNQLSGGATPEESFLPASSLSRS